MAAALHIDDKQKTTMVFHSAAVGQACGQLVFLDGCDVSLMADWREQDHWSVLSTKGYPITIHYPFQWPSNDHALTILHPISGQRTPKESSHVSLMCGHHERASCLWPMVHGIACLHFGFLWSELTIFFVIIGHSISSKVNNIGYQKQTIYHNRSFT